MERIRTQREGTGSAQSQSQAPRGRGEQSWDHWNDQIKAGEQHPGTAEATLLGSHSRVLYDESVHISDH